MNKNEDQFSVFIKKIIIGVVATLVVLITLSNSFYTVKSTERGVLSTFGKVEEKVVEPGLHAKVPFVQRIDKYTIVPQEYKLVVECVGQSAALSKDNQSLGYTSVINYQYNESDVLELQRTGAATDLQTTSRTNSYSLLNLQSRNSLHQTSRQASSL